MREARLLLEKIQALYPCTETRQPSLGLQGGVLILNVPVDDKNWRCVQIEAEDEMWPVEDLVVDIQRAINLELGKGGEAGK